MEEKAKDGRISPFKISTHQDTLVLDGTMPLPLPSSHNRNVLHIGNVKALYLIRKKLALESPIGKYGEKEKFR